MNASSERVNHDFVGELVNTYRNDLLTEMTDIREWFKSSILGANTSGYPLDFMDKGALQSIYKGRSFWQKN